MHIPVLLKETIKFLDPKPGEFIIDGTIGTGGHSAAILEKISPGGTLLGIDWDQNMLAKFKVERAAQLKIKSQKSKVILIKDNYANMPEILRKKKLGRADGLLLDLGFSSEQLESGRGFSFLKDELLDMRYNVGDEIKNQKSKVKSLTAAEIINRFPEQELAEIFWKYGEERHSRRIAQNIVRVRKKNKIRTTGELAAIVKNSITKGGRIWKIHPATRVFQALRIFVNRELDNIQIILRALPLIMASHGRVVVISFHSLEDRIVKNQFRELAQKGEAQILTKKPITPTEEEIEINPRSRSAKLRAIKFV